MHLPFTEPQFLQVFGAYNVALWPVVVALWLVTLAFTVEVLPARARASRGVRCPAGGALGMVRRGVSRGVLHADQSGRVVLRSIVRERGARGSCGWEC